MAKITVLGAGVCGLAAAMLLRRECLTLPSALFARPGFADRVLEVARQSDTPPPSGPTRDELLRLIA